ncbi:hypothetical protein LUZ60_007402 [Juncus effusus]|nr:hypothetical protein LUZ60_007402 [Juncus effusus]
MDSISKKRNKRRSNSDNQTTITLFFHTEVSEKRVDLYHPLKLFPEEETGNQVLYVKKPVVVETYDEVVFFEPTESFFVKVQNHPAAIVPRLPASFNLPPPGPIEHVSERKTKDHELLKLAAARQQVQAHIMKLRRQLSMLEGTPQQSKAASGQ